MTGKKMMHIAVKDRAWKTLKDNWSSAVIISAIYTVFIVVLWVFIKLGVNYFLPGDPISALGAGVLFGFFAVIISAPMLAAVLEMFNKMLNREDIKISGIFSWYTDKDKFIRAAITAIVFIGAILTAVIATVLSTAACGWFVRWLFSDFNVIVYGRNAFEIFAGMVGLCAGVAVLVQMIIWLNSALPVFYAVSHDMEQKPLRCFLTVFAKDFKYSSRFFALAASFALWYAAAIFSMGLLIPFVFPYVAMSYILFYKGCTVLDGKEPKLPGYAVRINHEREQKREQKKNKRKKKKKNKDEEQQSEE